MKIRADIAALIREGHTNAHIAHQLRCARSTVARHRHALNLPPADKLGRLYAEAIPTGRALKAPSGRLPLSPAQQAANRERLAAALREPAA
ncbi:helix-turn-helix domain-containing protein [Streptomyces sp. Z423-1]|uniref:helix-turn-helix domain-containing protein n=1 Tax=unclassified Streptomyces TaxID=2593676 RepID=UPI0014894942|nr:helix-turn-helix domain-containing protein [Streptomyces sp. Z423-1]